MSRIILSLQPVGASEASGAEVHHEDEKKAVDEQAEIGCLRVGQLEEAEDFRQGDEGEGSDDGAFEIAQAADDDHAEHEDAFVQGGGRGVEVANVGGVEGSGDGDEGAGDGDGLELDEAGVFAEAAGGEFVVADDEEQPAPG